MRVASRSRVSGRPSGWARLVDFVEQASYERFSAGAEENFEQLAARTGIPLDLALSVREATGSSRPEPSDRVREGELEILATSRRWSSMTSARPSWRRHSGLRRQPPTRRRYRERYVAVRHPWSDGPPGSVSAAGEATAEWSDALAEQTDRAILALLHGHQATAWMRNILEGFELTLVQAGLHERVERPTAICFLDLTGYTRLTEQFGDEAAADLAARRRGSSRRHQDATAVGRSNGSGTG